ncbi:unnamed protein product [Arctogadus glacialis]
MVLNLQTFKLAFTDEDLQLPQVYINCKLVAWDPEALSEERKACNYVKETGSWELLDDPSQSHLCSCCDSSCKYRHKRGADKSRGIAQNVVLGPLRFVNPPDEVGPRSTSRSDLIRNAPNNVTTALLRNPQHGGPVMSPGMTI